MQTHAGEIVKTFFHALETHSMNEIQHHLSGDCIVQAGTPSPLNKYQFLSTLTAIKQRFPELAVHIQILQEDNQFAQSNRVDAKVHVTGTLSEGKERNTLSHLSFTIMGDIIESIAVADAGEDGLAHLFMQVQPVVKDGTEAERSGQQEQSNEDDATRYNRQSNLYDPQGKSYTPSRQSLDYAPQVDA